MHENTMDTKSNIKAFLLLLAENLNWVLLFLMIAAGSALSRHFFTVSNLTNVLVQVSINGVLAAGFTIVILADGFDLSIGTIISICSVMAVGTLNKSQNAALAIVTALAVGCLFGMFNGLLIRLIKATTAIRFSLLWERCCWPRAAPIHTAEVLTSTVTTA